MAQSIRSFSKDKQPVVVRRRLSEGAKEILSASKEKRVPRLGLGYWGALAALRRGIA